MKDNDNRTIPDLNDDEEDVLEAEESGEQRQFIAGEDDASIRLDRFLSERMPDLSRSYIQRLIAEGNVSRDGKPQTSSSAKVRPGAQITISIPPPETIDLTPEAIPLSIVYEDDDVLVIDKPAGLVVHPSAGHTSGTLVNAVLNHAPDVELNGTHRPGIVHRLDKDTSGLMMVAKSSQAQAGLAAQIKEHQVVKEYLALAGGHVALDNGVIEAPIGRDLKNRKMMAIVDEAHGGRPARTHFYVLERIGGGSRQAYTLLRLRLETGRTHQIRVHLAAIGHPIIGDPVYGRSGLDLERQFLHAARLGFRLPSTGEYREFTSPLPPDLEAALEAARRS